MATHPSKKSKRKSKTASSRQASQAPHNIAQAIVAKDEDLFFLTDSNGELPLENREGFGLYYHDCRFLDGYELRLGGQKLNTLLASAERGYMATFELTNPTLPSNHTTIKTQSLGVAWERIIDASSLSLRDRLCFENYSTEPIDTSLEFVFSAQFDDVFEIRGMKPKRVGKVQSAKWQGSVLTFAYKGADEVRRSVAIAFAPAPRSHSESGASLRLNLKPGAKSELSLVISISESKEGLTPRKLPARKTSSGLASTLQRNQDNWLGEYTEVKSDCGLLNAVMDRSIRDLRLLRSNLDDEEYFSAGLPWYGALFGRDSVIASLQALAYEPGVAAQTLRLLARYQGKHEDAWRDEQPGKIMHELRRGELANLNEIPQTPYYGSVDSTPLFLVLMAEHARWSGSLELFHELRSNVDRALEWMDIYADVAGNGYLAYQSKSKQGLGNQGWKDSGVSIMNANGSLATPPISLVEVQGYAYLAKLGVASLCARAGDHDSAKRLDTQAAELRQRFNRDFWLGDLKYFALALQANNRPADAISSNPGQALWSGIVDESKAAKVASRLMKDDMFSGWGVRTLSSEAKRYNPVGYHLGTVWPHDNSIIVAGLRRYREDDAACRIFAGILDAARNFAHYRLPELFCGFSRKQYDRPVGYPVACHPQAWAAGSVPFMLTNLLGLKADGFNRRLNIEGPVLPDFIRLLELRRLRVGAASVDLRFERTAAGKLKVHVLKSRGRVEIDIS